MLKLANTTLHDVLLLSEGLIPSRFVGYFSGFEFCEIERSQRRSHLTPQDIVEKCVRELGAIGQTDVAA